MIKEIIDYNKNKYTHYNNLINLPKDVFDKNKNMFFCTFESFIDDFEFQINQLEEFIGIDIVCEKYPKINTTLNDWYDEQTSLYNQNLAIFDKWEDFIYDYCISIHEWEKLSEYMNIDLISLYNIS